MLKVAVWLSGGRHQRLDGGVWWRIGTHEWVLAQFAHWYLASLIHIDVRFAFIIDNGVANPVDIGRNLCEELCWRRNARVIGGMQETFRSDADNLCSAKPVKE